MTKNDHKSVLVPIENWEYSSPYLKYLGKNADIGIFAEALIYYEKIYVYINTVKEFEEFVNLFSIEGKVDDLIALINSKVINFFYYSFMSTAINNQGVFSIWNIQFKKEFQSDFIRLVVNKANLPISSKRRSLLWKAIVSNLIDEQSDSYDAPVEDAKEAMHDASKCAVLIQAYIDDIYKNFKLGLSPQVELKINDLKQGEWRIETNINFSEIKKISENKLDFRPEMPLIGEVQSNRLIWTSFNRGYDLFLGDVMSQIVGNKLYEAQEQIIKTKNIIIQLKSKVEFPDIRKGINEKSINIEDILNIRRHAGKFRTWLQNEGERDRDAMIAYHNEIAKASGITRGLSGSLKIFGNILQTIGPALYPVLTKDVSSPSNLVTTGAALASGEFIKQIGASINKDWRPVMFGDWIKKEINTKSQKK